MIRQFACYPVLSIALSITAIACAQQVAPSSPPAGSNWQHVQALPIGANIHVKAQRSSATCALKSVDADSLTCMHAKDITFTRAEIRSIAIPRRGRSTLVGLAIGGGAGAITGFAIGTGGNSNSFFGKNAFRGAISAVFAAGGAAVGAGLGAGTDFTHSTVYKVPKPEQ